MHFCCNRGVDKGKSEEEKEEGGDEKKTIRDSFSRSVTAHRARATFDTVFLLSRFVR